MDEKIEDKSQESLQRHLIFYKKLNRILKDLEKEISVKSDNEIFEHLEKRIKAINLDKERIRKLFPDTNRDIWEE